MRVRFGFVAMALSLKDASPSKTMTYKTFQSLEDREAALRKVTRIAESNLRNTLRILRHAFYSGIYVYRFSSKLIPLYGVPETKNWAFFEELQPQFRDIGEFVRSHEMRVSFHPDHFVVLNSPDNDVFHRSLENLDYHVQMFKAMNLKEEKMVIHVGGAYQDKEASLQRFINNWGNIPVEIRNRLTLENDDKIYTAANVQDLTTRIGVPLVFDIHHDRCNKEQDSQLSSIVEPFVESWKDTGLPPKAHISSPKDEANMRAHADLIRTEDILPFLDVVRPLNTDIDIMVEAKKKDEALFHLVKELVKEDFVHFTSDGVIEYRP
ncbi:UV DNA damage repair endonuclease UvsE [Alicyclobacillus sp. SO9]|uniref:UV DNA damage repair endonuclease UvsE n=1 Tax=Alicyclobacillus sp. SO9 TaxID=2665646 RepID=UPI0018E84CA9|nr:UV DNA damage repair endonuclease UvsE [Alicyclobacillus sp. SO9]QQE80130.1 UV DNA damage repair endonuclease UvsE [Alicyclobacillus sp. SO9]